MAAADLAAFTLIFLWLAASLIVAGWMTRRATDLFPEPLPLVTWPTLVSLRLATSDGEELGAWFHLGKSERPVLLLLHGNGGSRSRMLPLAKCLPPTVSVYCS